MMMAIEESRKSISEHKNKIDPMVGAIVTTSGGQILGKAYRGELREGEHCEYTLIERKLAGINLMDCVLYVTLEPCSDASRNKPKRGCATRISKARIKKVYVGIEDPNPKIAGKGILALHEKSISVEMFPAHLQSIIREINSDFMQEKEKEALQFKLETKIEKISPDQLQLPVSAATVDNFSEIAVQQFILMSNASFSYPSLEFNRWAEGIGFLVKNEKSGDLSPTGLGILLFGRNPELTFPQSVFKVEISYGDNKNEIRDFGGPLVTMLPAIIDFIKDKGLKLTYNKADGFRAEKSDFPIEILIEAIGNAVIHRDYTIEGATNYLYIDSEIIVVKSPGYPTYPLTLIDMQKFNAPSISRNPKIMYIFNQMKFAEQRGIGLRNMALLPDKGFPLPVFKLNSGILELTFGRSSVFWTKSFGIKSLSEEDIKVLLFIQKNGDASTNEVASHLRINYKTAQRQLFKLKSFGIVVPTGLGKNTRYKFKG